MLLVDYIVTGISWRLTRRAGNLFTLIELGDDAVNFEVFIGGLFAGAGNDERRTSFVDQDGIYFVDDGKVVSALHAIFQVKLHVVAQIVETEFVVGAVGDIGSMSIHKLVIRE